jgi:transcriptional regulator with XRE-family HTH domain
MKQPELGKRISQLRKAKGLTQGELAEKCNLSTRTIQRIESAEVTPRSYTIKIIFRCLNYDIYDSFGKMSYWMDRSAYKLQCWLGQLNKYVSELFNLKTNTMKKVMILSVPFLSVLLVLLLSGLDTKAQSEQEHKAILQETSAKFIHWFNAGEIDSIGLVYAEHSCMIPDNYREIHGRDNIKGYYKFLYNTGFRFNEAKTMKWVLTDSIAVERGIWSAKGLDGANIEITGTHLTQWRLINGKWYIENDMTNSDSPVSMNFGE